MIQERGHHWFHPADPINTTTVWLDPSTKHYDSGPPETDYEGHTTYPDERTWYEWNDFQAAVNFQTEQELDEARRSYSGVRLGDPSPWGVRFDPIKVDHGIANGIADGLIDSGKAINPTTGEFWHGLVNSLIMFTDLWAAGGYPDHKVLPSTDAAFQNLADVITSGNSYERSRLTTGILAPLLTGKFIGFAEKYSFPSNPRFGNFPKPPGWTEDWEFGISSRSNTTLNPNKTGGRSWWDPNGGEWRMHLDQHHNPHWDFNPWDNYNSPWRNVDLDGQFLFQWGSTKK